MSEATLLRKGLHLLLLLFSISPLARSQVQKQYAATPQLKVSRDGGLRVEQTLKLLSLEEKVGQMLQIWAYGDYQDFNGPDYLFVQNQIEKYHIGSVELGSRMLGPNLVKASPQQVATVLNQLQKDSKLPLLVGADIERGLASRVSDSPEFPFPMAFGAIGDPTIIQKFGEITAEEARAVGINWAYAPIADVNSNPDNPIINNRAIGEDPHEVSELVGAYIRGAHENKMLVTVKHFPGEGDTSTDPHVNITRIDASRQHLESVEFQPFKEAIRAGADSVMIAHVMVPALDPDPTKIATTSPKIIDGTLRKELGFRGVVITDALEMRGLTKLYPQEADPSGHIAADAIKAGADVLMVPRNVDAAYNAILAVVKSGEIPESRIDESVQRILQLKAELGLNESRYVDVSQVPKAFGSEAFEFAQQVSDSAVTLVKSNGKVLPLQNERAKNKSETSQPEVKLVVVIFSDSRRSRLGPTFEKELMTRRPDAQVFHYYNDQIGSDADPSVVLPAIQAADQVVLAAFESHALGRQTFLRGVPQNAVGLAGSGSDFFRDIVDTAPNKTVVVALGSPYLIEDYLQTQNYICTYSLTPTAEISAVRALFGEIKNHAKLPVTLPGVAERGTSIPWP